MARPRVIDPNGKTKTLTFIVSENAYKRLRREANKRGVTLGQVLRDRCEA